MHTDKGRYFVITSNTKENVVKSVRHSLWATQRKNEQRLDEAFRTASAVILVFSVNRSDAFQGYAQMRSPIGRPRSRGVDPFNGFGRLFDIEWLRLHDLPFREVESLRNPLNGDRPVQFWRDGQELANSTGRRLCGLIDRHIDDPESFPPPEDSQRMRAPPGQPGQGPPAVPGANATSMGAAPQGMYGLPTAPFLPPGSGISRRPCSRSSSGSSGRHRKRRKRERKSRRAPHPLEDSFEEQIKFFLSLDYDGYVAWWNRFGAVSAGPTPPPGSAPGLPVSHCPQPLHSGPMHGPPMHFSHHGTPTWPMPIGHEFCR